MRNEVKVYGTWFSPFAKSVEIALKVKGVAYEYVEEDLKNKSPILQKINPIYKKIPVLVHDGNPIVESLIIIEYIDQIFPGPSILPKDPYERSKARFWAKFMNEKATFPLLETCFKKGEERVKAEEEAVQTLQILENEIKGKKFFGGDNIGLVDMSASFVAHWFPILQEMATGTKLLSEDKFPNLCKWAHDYTNNPIVMELLPSKDQLVTAPRNASGRLY